MGCQSMCEYVCLYLLTYLLTYANSFTLRYQFITVLLTARYDYVINGALCFVYIDASLRRCTNLI